MKDVSGISGAAPAWAAFMNYAVPALTNNNPTLFPRPQGITEKVICALSGTEPSDNCPQQRTEYFAADQPPQPATEDLWKKVNIDTWTGLTASAECPDYAENKMTLNVTDKYAVKWIKDNDQGRAWASGVGFEWPITFVPSRECKSSDSRPHIIFAGMSDNQTITTNPLDIYAVVNATSNFKSFRLEWGPGDDPSEWKVLVDNVTNQYQNPERIYTWDLFNDPAAPSGKVTLRIWVSSTDNDTHAERSIHLNLNAPTPTPSPTPTLTVTPTATRTLVPSATTQPPKPTTSVPTVPTASQTPAP